MEGRIQQESATRTLEKSLDRRESESFLRASPTIKKSHSKIILPETNCKPWASRLGRSNQSQLREMHKRTAPFHHLLKGGRQSAMLGGTQRFGIVGSKGG